LREELAKELVCLLPDRSSRFSVQIGVFDSLSQRAKLLELGDMSVKIAISSQELDYWLAFFLRYFRDGFAEVDHIDVEMDESEVAEKVMLTLKVDEAVSPVSEDEARKRLRL
jgi:hypothetical protein